MAEQEKSQEQALTKRGQERLVEVLGAKLQVLLELAPAPVPPAKLISQLKMAIARDYKLAGCTSISVINAFGTALALGLQIAPREAYLVPFGRECQLLIDYRGKIKLALRNGRVLSINPQLVRALDKFKLHLGQTPAYEHDLFVFKPDPSGALIPVTEQEQGPVVGGYCVARMATGEEIFEFTPYWELAKIKASSRVKSPDGPWAKWEERMFLKSLVHRIFNRIPMDDQMIMSEEADASFETGKALPRLIESADERDEEPLDPSYAPPETPMPQRKGKPQREPGEEG